MIVETLNAYKILAGSPLGRARSKYKDNIKLYLEDIDG
jgi:hypothetical protein